MRYGIDLDGVVADINEVFKREANKIWPGRFAVGYIPTAWNFRDVISDIEASQVWDRMHARHNLWLEPKAYIDNVRAIALHRIRHPEDEIFYVTARHKTAGMPAMHQSQVWLQECGIGGLGTAVIVDSGADKSKIFNALECDANIDDRLEAVIEHNRQTKGAYLLARPWNEKGRPELRTVANLEQFFRRAGGITNVASS